MTDTLPPAIPAATLILLRDRPGAFPEIPMIGRGAHLAFAASRMVFPGGRVDADDHVFAGRPDLLVDGPAIDPEDLAHRITAIRETIEEIGLAPGIEAIGEVGRLAAMRAALHDGEPLSAILGRLGLRINPHDIHPFARWRPDHELSRRFDTRFYIARAPDLGEARADGSESSHLVWATAERHLANKALIFPTIRNLERIGQAGDFDAAVALARRYPVEMVTPWIETRDGEHFLCIPDTLGYPVTVAPIADVDRDSDPNRPSITLNPG
ncbi:MULTISPECIES: NUDIX hydrolase [unclassified Sphingomonas]|uniref:NUDIX hydrolase n=1 Tax=unclassified Sphingomonas TaxID=196159 RepID=UPI0006F1D3FD|nr:MULTISPECIES: NUDIX hydrolase [unclassified Sphingomonas]KQX18060.1 NUDIX hydrolase [Sphingomonas sp. Root1294]KQY72615.1 NUDIX hydrolase [Sphingomonas sp. Root50]KRB87761.1 NUDIX hydrolase [Sphingomonas sp. Root720]